MTKQRGNILFLILLAIVLFVALTYAVNSGMRGGGKDGGAESARSAAAAIINHGTLMQQTVNRLMLTNGCKESELSFEDSYDTNYVNNTRADGTCKVFGDKGGGLEYPVPDPNWSVTAASTPMSASPGRFYLNKWFFYSGTCVPNVGTGSTKVGGTYCWNNGVLTDNDLVVFLTGVKQDVCLAINAQAGIPAMTDGTPQISQGGSVTWGTSQQYVGAFTGYSGSNTQYLGGVAVNGGVQTAFDDKHFGCFQVDAGSGVGSGIYVFYQVLLAR